MQSKDRIVMKDLAQKFSALPFLYRFALIYFALRVLMVLVTIPEQYVILRIPLAMLLARMVQINDSPNSAKQIQSVKIPVGTEAVREAMESDEPLELIITNKEMRMVQN